MAVGVSLDSLPLPRCVRHVDDMGRAVELALSMAGTESGYPSMYMSEVIVLGLGTEVGTAGSQALH